MGSAGTSSRVRHWIARLLYGPAEDTAREAARCARLSSVDADVDAARARMREAIFAAEREAVRRAKQSRPRIPRPQSMPDIEEHHR